MRLLLIFLFLRLLLPHEICCLTLFEKRCQCPIVVVVASVVATTVALGVGFHVGHVKNTRRNTEPW